MEKMKKIIVVVAGFLGLGLLLFLCENRGREKSPEEKAEDFEELRQINRRYKDLEEVGKRYREAAEKGNSVAQFLWGEVYYDGIETRQDVEEAFKWYRRSARQGFAAAQFVLGWYYWVGVGTLVEDQETAEKWYFKAAEQGYATAQYEMGSIYYKKSKDKGKRAAEYRAEAVKWFRKAANQDRSQLIWNLKGSYSLDGEEKDVIEMAEFMLESMGEPVK